MSIVDRIKNICLTPNTEWPVIANEPGSTGSLIAGYVAPLAAVSAVAGFIGVSLVGQTGFFTGTYRLPLVAGLALAVWTFIGAIIGVVVVGFLINALAPTFGAQQNSAQAMKVAVYSFTPAWIAGVLRIVPALGILAILGAFYGFYLLYLGLPALMKAPKDKAAGYTVVTVVAAVIVIFVVNIVGGLMVAGGAIGSGMLGGIARDRQPVERQRGAVRQEQPARQTAGIQQGDGGERQEDGRRSEERRCQCRDRSGHGHARYALRRRQEGRPARDRSD